MSINRSAIYVGLMVVAAAVAGYMVSLKLARGAVPVLQTGTVYPAPRQVAAFALTDHLGASFSNERLAGHPTLVFFGFTHCPDVCPTTLAMLAQLQRNPALESLQIVFVTVDPGRDNQQSLLHYVNAFGAGIVGLRGEDAALESLLRSLSAARSVRPGVGSDYAVDHSATLHYVNSRGMLSAVFTPPFNHAALGGDLAKLIASGY